MFVFTLYIAHTKKNFHSRFVLLVKDYIMENSLGEKPALHFFLSNELHISN